ncbi:hypothetical protein NQ036_06920 [Brevibacterium sp. 91QC2O2]|uniref:hypothetical protein n=1 Tax=Brevibacterium sp. 91QC2O2 TaxID=2968458 RepID=UPI00211C3B3D|nr:hypothetical protein [Brevibacterium sp. 91QC2O2]MCQ9367976.1 hypothetical protein [Brevibacterium sp. 91QC2O2]
MTITQGDRDMARAAFLVDKAIHRAHIEVNVLQKKLAELDAHQAYAMSRWDLLDDMVALAPAITRDAQGYCKGIDQIANVLQPHSPADLAQMVRDGRDPQYVPVEDWTGQDDATEGETDKPFPHMVARRAADRGGDGDDFHEPAAG